ncbi:hypothetical protein RW03080701_167 [Synechococcus phage S-RIM8]|uniref:Uncharacterized protein n=1 Tax=Synechococcus phage S-RIM8 TaxID=756278 RepID=A0A1D7SAA4_9CAUD|nr:hypothetical protein RW03080701_167 [Synechococcus phage S-RIM8]
MYYIDKIIHLVMAYFKIENVDEYKTLIDKLIVEENLEDISKEYTTKYGLQYNLYHSERARNELTPITDIIVKKIKETSNQISNADLIAAWTCIGKKGTYHTAHKHNTNNDLVAVLYLECPEASYPDGAIYFIENNEVYRHMPETGDLLVFPATTIHGTYPQGEGLRQTLNMDFRITSR